MSSTHLSKITVLLTIFIAGCVNNTDTSNSAKIAGLPSSEVRVEKSQSPDEIICTYEKIVGKLIKEKYCYTRKKREKLREDSQKANKTMKSRDISSPDY